MDWMLAAYLSGEKIITRYEAYELMEIPDED